MTLAGFLRQGHPPERPWRRPNLPRRPILAYCYAADDGRAGCDPDVFLDRDGLSNSGASLGRFEGMARRDDADVRPDHHVVRDVEAAEIIKVQF